MATFSCTVVGLPVGPNASRYMHWGTKKRINDACVEQIAWAIKGWPDRPAVPWQRARVTFTLLRSRGPAKDFDNAVATLKRAIDQLVVHGLLVDDRTENIDLVVRQEPKRGRTHDLELTVEHLQGEMT